MLFQDHSGYLEKKELDKFIKDLIQQKGQVVRLLFLFYAFTHEIKKYIYITMNKPTITNQFQGY
jgi:hypothetical protein